jgi:hypothetical protein
MAARASSGPPSVASDGEHSHSSHSPSDGRRDRRKRKQSNRWLTALMVVDFDVDTGHKPVFCIPTGAVRPGPCLCICHIARQSHDLCSYLVESNNSCNDAWFGTAIISFCVAE